MIRARDPSRKLFFVGAQLESQGVDLGAELAAQCLVHEAMTRDPTHPAEPLGSHPDAKVTGSVGGARVSSVRSALVDHLEGYRRERRAQQSFDAGAPIHGPSMGPGAG